MIPKELFKKIRNIEITTNRLVTDVFAGQYHSVFKGRGMEFDEVREYQIGDDIRTIDWNVTARTGQAHVKKFIEERELTVMLLVDASMSCRFSTSNQLKSRLAAEIAAVLAFSAIRNNDKVGLIFFTDKIEKFIPPRKGIKNVLRVVREILYFDPENNKTDISNALEYLSKVTSRKTVSFLISDFFETIKPEGKEPSYKKAMAITNKRHDLIAVTLNDPIEQELPECGLISLEDAETGDIKIIDSSDKEVRKKYREKALLRLDKRNRLLNSLGVDHVFINTDSSYTKELVRFFVKRQRRKF